jgi:F0F1-type ATP synthase membrane subunit c/vacuolar-type H+-ATPase subunit K
MRKIRRWKVLGWRWRTNTLRRHSDVLEAWIVLAAWTVALVAAVVAGVIGSRIVQRAVEHDRAGRLPVPAVLVKVVPASGRDLVTGFKYDQVRATVRWTDAKGTTRTGTMVVEPAAKPGGRVTAWTDGHGRLVAAPVNTAEATTRVVLAGTGAALTAGLTVLGAGFVARLRIQRRAIDRWGAEWERVGRQWGHTTG